METAKTKAEDGGEPSKLAKENIVMAVDGSDNASLKTLKQDKCIYKMPIYEPLQKGPDGQEKSLRIPEHITKSVDPDFLDKAKKVRYMLLYVILFSPTL